MEQHKVCKFGGSSVSAASKIKRLAYILKSDPSRKYVVVSAPGKNSKQEQKITDHLINIADDGKHAHASYYSNVDIVESSLSCSPCWDFQHSNCSDKPNYPICMYRMKPKRVFNRVREMLYGEDI